MAFGQTARWMIAGLYVLAMLFVAVMPASSIASMSPSPIVTSAADCGLGMGDMKHASQGAKVAGGACDLADHQTGSPCMVGSACADLPSGMFVSVLPTPSVTASEQPAVLSSSPLPGRDPAPGLRPPSLSV